MTTERRVCEVSDQSGDCKAPAGFGCAGGWAEGEGSCRGTCVACGHPCCAACSARRRRGRICNDCRGAQ